MQYFRNVIKEFPSIRWLSIRRVLYFAVIAIVIAIIVGYLLGLLDNSLGNLLGKVIA